MSKTSRMVVVQRLSVEQFTLRPYVDQGLGLSPISSWRTLTNWSRENNIKEWLTIAYSASKFLFRLVVLILPSSDVPTQQTTTDPKNQESNTTSNAAEENAETPSSMTNGPSTATGSEYAV
ncbi:uncharacterized protein CTHT_0044700 [Thermochaetoides thermophila DSM 1495]|uniref:Uncharacterized protein n=1 Tax=Chaetomium thermophilum (strain DSM 1495 / CBS 144.50 / IMI 039719) TaxID=759272 RepID=G0S963_CHATD|nr:hypothetical protein CTHT_0044700 [Thermochaetoides thermophila DSM 1495]EGS19974.1 hypothetical protein CTHT_0044700 [Thermochaetoides thermophila DSM 1495]